VVSDDTVRLGFCVVNGLRKEHGEGLVAERERVPFRSLDDFKRRVELSKEELRTIAELGTLNCFAEHRRSAMWKVEEEPPEPLFDRRPKQSAATALTTAPLKEMSLPERVKADYTAMNLTTGPHPMKLLRAQLPEIWRASDLRSARHGSTIQIAGNVICRQRPGTAKGFVFVSLEDETGVSNAIVTPDLFEQMRLLITEEPFLIIKGQVQNTENVVLIKADKIRPLAHEQLIGSESHDFR
jgi:error-prone DNA polymerase